MKKENLGNFIIKNLVFILLIIHSGLVFCQPTPELWQEYYKGVSNAFEFQKLKQERSLFNIDSSNSLLEIACRPEWKCVPGGHWEEKGKFKPYVRVKMVTLISSTANMYSEYMGSERKYPLRGRIIWVTAFPELKNYCKKISDKKLLKLSLEKFLGLPADTTKEKVVSLWVKPDDLMRPCFSPDITTTSCPLSPPADVSPDHLKWLNGTIEGSFSSPGQGNSYPFTRLGFSYFWGNPQTKMGASEYVVKPTAKIFIDKVETIEEYCR
jgi:hypothetical protein